MSANTTAPLIRVIEVTTTSFGGDIRTSEKPDPVWQGTDINELSILYPPSDIMGADPLGRSEIEDGYIVTTHRYERQNPDGTWAEIDDPRWRITPMTDLEYEIDRENRERFPGDYMDADDPYPGGCIVCNYEGCDQCRADLSKCYECGDILHYSIVSAGLCPECQSTCPLCRRPHIDNRTQGELCAGCSDYWDRNIR